MRHLLLIFFLFCFGIASAQTYSTSDTDVLKSIKQRCDKNDNLNWMDTNPYDTWEGITWISDSGEERVYKIEIDNKSLSETLDVSSLPELHTLQAAKNTIKAVKLSSGQKLSYIDLSENDITAASFVNLSSLWYLNLDKNDISAFQLSQLPKLEILYASDNQISNLNLSSFMKLEEVTLARNKLDSVNVTGLDSLRVLGLDENRLTGVTGLSDVVLLETLYLGKNNISAIDLAGLTKLVNIELSYNNLSVFNSPNSVNLIFLGLGKNKLSTVDVSNFTKLKNLVLDSNKITSIRYSSLNSLEYLLMRANQCSKLDFNKFKNLRFLAISDNLFDTLSIDSLTNLELFHCDKNNLPLSQLEKIVKIRPIANWTDLGSTKGVLYSPQGLVYDTLKLEKGNSVNYQSEASINSVSSSINWFLNSNPIVSGDVSNNLNVFTFNKLGSYHSEMTNSSLPNLTIKTNPIIVTKITPTVTWPSFSVIDYRDTLKSATMTGGSASVPGVFGFKNGDKLLSAGVHSVAVEFTPVDLTNYNIKDTVVNINVKKAVPGTSFPMLNSIKHGDILSKSILSSANFKFKNPSQVMTVGKHSVEVIFTPIDTNNYNTVSKQLEIIVEKLDQNIIWNQTLDEVVVGDVLDLLATTSSNLDIKVTVLPVDAFNVDKLSLKANTPYEAVKVTLSQIGDSIHNSAKPITKTITISEKVLSLPKLQEVKIYPNPTDGLFTIEGMKSGSTLRLFNVQGTQLMKRKVTRKIEKINISRFEKGIYIVEANGYYFRVQLK